jgi:NAD(P)-dependent dehydrogenase (short-subunit alcohol dehydrogenase family)
MARSTTLQMPDLRGKRAVITGASDGIGLALARRLAAAGCELVLPVRNAAKGAAAVEKILDAVPTAVVSTRPFDLASLASVAAFADGLVAEGQPVNFLVNNAGVMTPPTRQLTEDGFELQLGANYLGHFALVQRLLPVLRAGSARVTSQTSFAADRAAINWSDLQFTSKYSPAPSYAQSKLALMLFGLELDRRSRADSWGIRSNVAHPGIAATNLLAAHPELGRTRDTGLVRAIRLFSRLGILVQTSEGGLLPALYAATDPEAEGGGFYGPGGFLHLSGPAARQEIYESASSPADAERMWDISESLTGASFPTLPH